MKTVSVIRKSGLQKAQNDISTHTIYTVKMNDDNSLKLNSRVGSHGNLFSINNELKY